MRPLIILISWALVLFAQHNGLAQEFPIGAWWPGLFDDQSGQFAARLDAVDNAHFNTIHAAQGGRNTAEENQDFIGPAHDRELQVQLANWDVPEHWWAESRTYWAMTLEAEDGDIFDHDVGVQDGGAWRADTMLHTSGMMLDTPATGDGIYLHYEPERLDDAGRVAASTARHTVHVFCLKTDDNSGSDRIATLRILRHSDGTVLGRSRDVLKSHFNAEDTYQDFFINYRTPPNGETVRYQIEWTDNGNLWVDRITAYDSYGRRLFQGRYDTVINDALSAYDGVTADPPWRFYLDDEPRWGQKDESIAYVNDEFIRPQSGQSGVVAFHQTDRGLMEHFVDTVSPSEFLVDFYTFGDEMPTHHDRDYADALRHRLDRLATWYGDAREVARGARIPLWVVVQGHDWANLRDPTPAEIRVQVNMALAHGATGIYYFMFSSHTNSDAAAEVSGLVNDTYQSTPKLERVTALNAKLQALAPTYLALRSKEVFPGGSPDDFVQSLSDGADFFLGTFTHTDGPRYLMVVNRLCQPTETPRTTAVTLDASGLNGSTHYCPAVG